MDALYKTDHIKENDKGAAVADCSVFAALDSDALGTIFSKAAVLSVDDDV